MNEVPKLKSWSLYTYIGDLLLVSEGSHEWVKAPKVRFTIQLMFWSFIIFVVTHWAFRIFVMDYFIGSNLAAIIYRSYVLSFWIAFLVLSISLARYHYIDLLSTGKDLRFSSIAFFGFLAVADFGYIYSCIYMIDPSLFVYKDSIVVPEPFLSPVPGLRSYFLTLDFLLYSCTAILSLPYSRIQSDSAIVTFVNCVQMICGLGLISLVVAMFVQKTDTRRHSS